MIKDDKDKIKKLIVFSERTIQMINEIREQNGMLTDQEVVRASIAFYYEKLNPSYLNKNK